MATPSFVSSEQPSAVREELLELLRVNPPRIDLGNLQGLYRKHFQKDLSIKKYGISSVKQLVALFGDVMEIISLGKSQFLRLKPVPPLPQAEKSTSAVKNISAKKSAAMSECSFATSSSSSDSKPDTNVYPPSDGRPVQVNLKKDLVDLLQDSSEGYIGLHSLPESYRQRYNRSMKLEEHGITSVESIVDAFSDVFETFSHCDELKHKYVRSKSVHAGTTQDTRSETPAKKMLREELEELVKGKSKGISLTALNRKYSQAFRKNIPKAKDIMKTYKNDFEFFSKCSTKGHQFLRLKPVQSRAEVDVEGSGIQSPIPQPALTVHNSTVPGHSLGLLGAAPGIYSTGYQSVQPMGFGGVAVGLSNSSSPSLLGAPPVRLASPIPLMALNVGPTVQSMQQQQHQQGLLWDHPIRVQDVPSQQDQQQHQHQPRQQQQQLHQQQQDQEQSTEGIVNEHLQQDHLQWDSKAHPVLQIEQGSKKESEQSSAITYGTLSANEMLQLLSKDQQPKQSMVMKQQQQQPYERDLLQGQPHKRKSISKQQDKSQSEADSAVRASETLIDLQQKLSVGTKQKQQQQQPQWQAPEERQVHQLQQQPYQRQSGSAKQQDSNQSKEDAMAQTIIANLAEANELVTVDRVVDLLKQHFQVTNLRKLLGLRRETDIPSLNQLVRLQSKVNAFIQAFVKVRAICTLHELRESLAMVDAPIGSMERLDYSALQLGPLTKQPLVWEFFKFPPTKADSEIPKITTSDVLEVLNKFLTEKDLWRKRVKLENFMEYIIKEYDVEGPYDLGLRIQSVGLGIAAIKNAKHEQKTTMDRAREELKTSLSEEVTATMEKIRKAVMSPADITGHQFTPGPQLELRRRYVNMTAAEAINMVFTNAYELTDYSRNLRQFCLSLRNVVTDRFSRSLFQLAICSGDLSKPDDLPVDIMDSDEEEEEDDSEPEKEKSPAKAQPTEDQVKEELLHYLDRLQHGGLNLKDLARIEIKLCQHFGFHDFTSLSRARRTFLQFLSLDHPGVLESVSGSLMGLMSGSPSVSQGSIYRPSRMDLVEFIRQCNPQKEADEALISSLCAHYQVGSVEELGHGPLKHLSHQILKMAGKLGHQQECNAVIYETALCASNRRNESKRKEVGLCGSQTLESALMCLASAPLLEDLVEWSHWSLIFEPEHGNLKTFLERNPGQSLSPPIEISALEVRPGVLLRLATETSPDLFAAAAKSADSIATVGHLVSLVVKDGLGNVPLALLGNHMETALNMMAVDSDRATVRHSAVVTFVLDCLVAMPLLIGQAVVRQVILNPLTTALGSEVKSRQMILKTCETTAQKTKIQSLGLLLGISQWSDNFMGERMPQNVDKEEDFSVDEEKFDIHNFLAMEKALKSSEMAQKEDKSSATAVDDSVDSSISVLQEVESLEDGKDELDEKVTADADEDEVDKREEEEEDKDVCKDDLSDSGKEEVQGEGLDGTVNSSEIPSEEEMSASSDSAESEMQPCPGELEKAEDDNPSPEPSLELTPFQQSVLDCGMVIRSIRKEEFGIGMELDEEAQQLMVRHQERIGRSLKRLSEELYSRDTHFVLELIQNADDNDYEEGTEPSLVFVVSRSEVKVLNNERGFTENNIRALCDVGRSTKGKHKRGYIGHKGIGFKSVFRVTDKPEITSNGYHVCFDRSVDQMGYILPTWVGPKEIQDIAEMEEPPKPWTTKITLPLKGDIQRTISLVNKFEDIQPSLLLFLNRLQSIIIINKEDGTTSHMSRRDRENNVVEIRHSKNSDSWLLIKTCLDATKLQRLGIESTELGLAFLLSDGMSSEQNVFAFLPLRSYGFHFIIQGDFDIPSSREDIDADSAWNQWLLQEIAPLFIQALEMFKTHYRDPIKAVVQFLKFVPLDSQILTDFFRKVAVDIHYRLKATPCMPIVTGDEEDEVTWKLPSETIMCPDRLVREVVPSDTLRAHLNCSYLHHRVGSSVSEVLLKSLGVKVLQTGELIDIFRNIAFDAKQTGESLTPKCVAQWLTCIYRSREREYDISQETLDRLRTIPMIPLSSGQVVTMEEGSVFFPISEEEETDHLQGPIRSAFSKPLQALEEDMSTLDGMVLTGLDKVANSQIIRLLEDLGVRHISPRDVIHHHILPVIQSDQWKDKSRDVMVGYVVYIKEQLEKQSDVCNLEEVANCLHVVTNHGLIIPKERPVHFTVTYGNQVDLNTALPGCDWVLLDSCYIFHSGAHGITGNEVRQWQAFFRKLGVLNYLAVEKKTVRVKEEELDVTPWADLCKFWEKPADGVYIIHDNVCQEFEELVQADLDIYTMINQRQNLLKLLQLEWSSNYATYKSAVVCDQSGTKLADTQSSFAVHLKTKAWLPSTPVSGESDNPVDFRSPAEIFIPLERTKALLSTHVPYLNAQVQREGNQMLAFIGVKTAGVIDVSFMISLLKTWCSDDDESLDLTAKTPFCTSLGHISRVYEYLAENCRPQELRALFGDHRVMFIPHVSAENFESDVPGQFVHKSLVYWQDPTNLLQKYSKSTNRTQLAAFYTHMEEFFLQQVSVDRMPTIKEYAQLLVLCTADIMLPNGPRIKNEVLALYHMLGYKCVLTSSARHALRQDLFSSSTAQQKLEVDLKSAQYVRNLLEEQPVFPTLGNKWVTLKDKPLLCDDHSGDLQKLFLDKREVHLLNLGDRDRLGRVIEHASGLVEKQHVQVFLEVCGIEKLSDCIQEEFITQYSKPSLPLRLFLHEICPYVQLYMHQNTKTEFQPTYKKLTAEVNIAAKLRVMQFMAASTVEKIYRLKHDPNVFAKQSVDCGLTELKEFYIVSSISQTLRQNSDVRREVAKLFSCGSVEVQGALFDFLGSLLLELGFRKREADNKGVDGNICRALKLTFPREGSDESWEVPKPFIPEEVVVKPVKVKPVPEQKPQPAAGTLLEDDDDAGIHSWPPKSGTYGPQTVAKAGSQPPKDDVGLKMWPPPQPPVSAQPSLFPPPPGPPQPTYRQQPKNDGALQEGAAGVATTHSYQEGQDGIPEQALGAVVNRGQASHGQATGQGPSRDGLSLISHHLPSEGGSPQQGSPQAQQVGSVPEKSVSSPPEAEETLEEEEESSTSEEEPSEDESEAVEDDDNDEHGTQGDTQSLETLDGQFHTPPHIQRSAALSYPSSSSIKKFFVPPHADGEAIELEFEDLEFDRPALVEGLTVADLPPGDTVDTTDIARWGENLVYLYLMQEVASMGSEVTVKWVNQQNETGEPYDIIITHGSTVIYVEVKSTIRDQKQVIEISPKEVAFAQEKRQLFHLYRVFNAGNTTGVRLCRLRDLALRMDRKEVKLFMYL